MMKLVLVLAALASPASASGQTRANRYDREATRTYLESIYAYQRSLVSSVASSQATVERLASRTAAECPGVLADAPQESLGLRIGEHLSARQRGEANRTERQRLDLNREIEHAFEVALIEPVRATALSSARTLASLRWSQPVLTRYVHTTALELAWDASGTTSTLCADLQAWVQSGYTRLSPATKLLTSRRNAIETPLSELSGGASPGPAKLLHRTEAPSERALRLKILALEKHSAAALQGLGVIEKRLESVVGIHTAEEEREQPPRGALAIARGRTATGGSYTIWVEHEPRRESGEHCDASVGYRAFETRNTKHGLEGSGFGSEACLSRSHPQPLRAFCNGTDWEVEGQTAEGASTATVTVRGGGQINTPVALVPASLGGPLGFYFQVLPVSDDPVSLSELNAQGSVLATVALPHQPKCPGRPPGVPKAPSPPKQVAGGVIVSARIPHGPRLQVLGELDRYMGHLESNLSVLVYGESQSRSGSEGSINFPAPPHRPSPFKLQTETGCRPHEFAVLYGVLKKRGDRVLAASPRGPRRFRTVAITGRLRIHGVLAYLVVGAMPDKVVVRTASGRTVSLIQLRKRAREAREMCEGETES